MRPAHHALIVIDVQNDFCPGGALAVAQGDAIIPQINALMGQFQTVVLTQDWHPADHSSFAANHAGAAPFSTVQMPYGAQTLWPCAAIWRKWCSAKGFARRLTAIPRCLRMTRQPQLALTATCAHAGSRD